MQTFEHDTSREATDSIRGYVYQIYQSLYSWIRLEDDQVLYLERAEDFDVQSQNQVITTQVKDTAKSGNVTLTTPGCVAALNNYWKFRNDNPETTVLFRYLTTSEPGKEQGSSFSSPNKGIPYWMQAAHDSSLSLSPIRDHLKGLPLAPPLAEFVESSTDDDFRVNLVKPIHWDTGAKCTDALIQDIKKRLILHGDRFCITPHGSIKALGDLLQHTIATITSISERKLTREGFLVCFEQATQVLVPKGTADQYNRTAGMLPTYQIPGQLSPGHFNPHAETVLRPPFPLIKDIAPRTPLVRSISEFLRGKRIIFLHGSTGVGKTAIAGLVTLSLGGSWVYSSFRNRDKNETKYVLDKAFYELEATDKDISIVLDDIDFEAISTFENELVILLNTAIQDGRKVILTSYNSPPNNTLRKLSIDRNCTKSVPYFCVDDVLSLLEGHPISDKLREPYANFILATTSGHPQLVHARIHNYANQGWPPFSMEHILKDDDIEDERKDIRTRLVEEIPSEHARTLIHRLSLMTSNFSRQLALGIASLTPSVPLPGELFDSLVGPWIEDVGDEDFRLSPLLYNSAKHVFTDSEVQLLHENIALTILKQKTLDIFRLNACIYHACISKSESALSALCYATSNKLSDIIDALAQYDGFFNWMCLEEGQKICDTNPHIEALVRHLQFRVIAATGNSEKAISCYNRWIEAINEMDESVPEIRSHMLGMAYYSLLSSYKIITPPALSIDAFSQLIDLEHTDEFIAHVLNNMRNSIRSEKDMEYIDPYSMLAGMITASFKGADSFVSLLNEIDKLPSDKRQKLFVSHRSSEMCFGDAVVRSCWLPEVKLEDFDVYKVISALNSGVTYGRKWDYDDLLIASTVAISVLYDEYTDDPEQALSVLACSEHQNDGRVLYQRGKIAFNKKDYPTVIKVIPAAIDEPDLSNSEIIFATRHLAIAEAKQDNWPGAKEQFLIAANKAYAISSLKTLALGLELETAFADWNIGNKAEVISRIRDVLVQLKSFSPDESLKNRQLHALVRHFLGWLKEQASKNEGQLEAPHPGLLSTMDTFEELKAHPIVEENVAWGMLRTIDATLETNIEFPSEGEGAVEKMPLIMKVMSIHDKFERRWNKDDIENGASQTINLIKGFYTVQQMRLSDNITDTTFALGDLQDIPTEYWDDDGNVERFILILSTIGVKALAGSISIPTNKWREAILTGGINAPSILRSIDCMGGNIYSPPGQLYEAVTNALAMLQKECSATNTVLHHYRLLNLAQNEPYHKFCATELAKLVSSSWQRIVENRRFEIISPSINCPAIIKACENKYLEGCAKVAAILLIAFPATGVGISASAVDSMRCLVSEQQ